MHTEPTRDLRGVALNIFYASILSKEMTPAERCSLIEAFDALVTQHGFTIIHITRARGSA